jgi:tRNA A58 N-methylase Trm61
LNDGDSQGAELLIKWLDRRAQLLVEIDAAMIFARADFVKKKLYVIRSYP